MKKGIIFLSLLGDMFAIGMDCNKMLYNDRSHALFTAATMEDKGEIQKILQLSKDKETLEHDIVNALSKLASQNYDKGIRLLLQSGVSPLFKDAISELNSLEMSSFQLAAWYGRQRSLMAMLELSSNTESPDKYGDTALLIALSMGHPQAVRTLLDYGADPTVKGFLRRDPLRVCRHAIENLDQHQERLSKIFDVKKKRQDYQECQQLIEKALSTKKGHVVS